MKLREIPWAARIELLEPLSQKPGPRYLLQLATTATQTFYNELALTGRPWAVKETAFDVLPGAGEYALADTDISRVMDVTTADPGNDVHIERQIPFWDLADLRHDWVGPRNAQWQYFDSNHTAQRISFYRKDLQNAVYAQVWPVPELSCTYRVLYSQTGSAPDMALDNSPLLAQHHALLTCETALSALPGCAWSADEKTNTVRRGELEKSLSRRLPTYMDQFKRYIRSINQSRMTKRLTYAID